VHILAQLVLVPAERVHCRIASSWQQSTEAVSWKTNSMVINKNQTGCL
jgi:hypothetical protein